MLRRAFARHRKDGIMKATATRVIAVGPGLGLLALAGALALAGCNSKQKPEAAESDSAIGGSLGDRIVVDPEKAGGSTSAASGAAITLAPAARTPEAVAAAKKSAADAAGGKLLPAPAPQKGGAPALAQNAASAAQITDAARKAKTDCAGKVQYSEAWAKKLPAAIPVYPRGAVQEAAGTDAEGCALRVVNYAVPVSPEDVVSFYYSMAQRGGYSAEYRLDGGDHVIGGRKGGQAYVVYARKLDGGVTEVDLVASGK
jgi:hypothetical protein